MGRSSAVADWQVRTAARGGELVGGKHGETALLHIGRWKVAEQDQAANLGGTAQQVVDVVRVQPFENVLDAGFEFVIVEKSPVRIRRKRKAIGQLFWMPLGDELGAKWSFRQHLALWNTSAIVNSLNH